MEVEGGYVPLWIPIFQYISTSDLLIMDLRCVTGSYTMCRHPGGRTEVLRAVKTRQGASIYLGDRLVFRPQVRPIADGARRGLLQKDTRLSGLNQAVNRQRRALYRVNLKLRCISSFLSSQTPISYI